MSTRGWIDRWIDRQIMPRVHMSIRVSLSLSPFFLSLFLCRNMCVHVHIIRTETFMQCIYIYMVYANRNIISCTHLSIYLSIYLHIYIYMCIPMDHGFTQCKVQISTCCTLSGNTMVSHFPHLSAVGRWVLRGATTSFCQWSGSSLLARPPAIQSFMESICGPGCCAPNSARESQTA